MRVNVFPAHWVPHPSVFRFLLLLWVKSRVLLKIWKLTFVLALPTRNPEPGFFFGGGKKHSGAPSADKKNGSPKKREKNQNVLVFFWSLWQSFFEQKNSSAFYTLYSAGLKRSRTKVDTAEHMAESRQVFRHIPLTLTLSLMETFCGATCLFESIVFLLWGILPRARLSAEHAGVQEPVSNPHGLDHGPNPSYLQSENTVVVVHYSHKKKNSNLAESHCANEKKKMRKKCSVMGKREKSGHSHFWKKSG